jgi:hypothetical protein
VPLLLFVAAFLLTASIWARAQALPSCWLSPCTAGNDPAPEFSLHIHLPVWFEAAWLSLARAQDAPPASADRLAPEHDDPQEALAAFEALAELPAPRLLSWDRNDRPVSQH